MIDPTELGNAVKIASELFVLREQMARLRKATTELQPLVDELEAQLLTLGTHGDAVTCEGGTIRVVTQSKAVLTNPSLFYKHVAKTGEVDLLGGLSRPAVRERWEQGLTVPGVIRQDTLDLSYSTVSRKQKE